jgi:hypothetical protein
MPSGTEQNNGPIAIRHLREEATGIALELRVYAPTPDPSSSHGDWICRTELLREATSTNFSGYGVDALQALISGLAAMRFGMKQLGTSKLKWVGAVGEIGLPLIVQEMDEDFLTLVEGLVSAEHSRQLVLRKGLKRG